MRSFTSSLDPICILSSLFWKEGEKKERKKREEKEKKREKKVREKVKKSQRKKKKGKEKKVWEKKEKRKKNWIYLESISYLNSDWNLFCALFSKTGVSSSYEVRFGSVSTQIEDSDEPHLNSCRS